ncbi:MAG: hypothetical protein ACRDHX_08120 [Chloroflexota bacterium]
MKGLSPSVGMRAAGLAAALLAFGSAPWPVLAQTHQPSASRTSNAAPAAKPAPAGPVLTVVPGFQGMGKIGDWLPVTVDVANDGPSVTGQLQIELSDEGTGSPNRFRSFTGRPATSYSVDATVPSHSQKRYQIDVFLPTIVNTITARLVTDQGVLVQQAGKLQALSGADVLCGTMSRNQAFFQQLGNLDLPGRPGRKPFIAALSPQDLPASQHALSSLDCLVASNVSLAGLSDDQKAALVGWVHNGGLLVLTGGTGWQQTLRPLPVELQPVRISGVRALPDLQPLADFAHQPFVGNGPWLVTAGSVVNATTVLGEQGVPLLVGARRGKGSVVYLAVDPTTEPMATWGGNSALWKYVMSYNSTPLSVFPFFGAFGGFSSVQTWGVPPRSALYNLGGVDMPSGRWLLLLAGVYALIAGPLNYAALTLAGRRELGLLTIPLAVAAGGWIAFHVAQGYRGGDIILNSVSVVRADGSTGAGNVRSYVALYTPRSADYQLLLPGTASATSFAPPGFPGAGYRAGGKAAHPWQLNVTEGESATRVAMPLNQADTGTFFTDSQVQLAGGFTSSLQVRGNTIAGSVTNHTGEAVGDVILALGSAVTHLGNMSNGQTRSVQMRFDSSAPATPPNANAIKNSLNLAVGPGGQQPARVADKAAVIDAFLGSNSSEPAELSGLTLMGWLPRSPLPIQLLGWRPSVKETTLYVAPLVVSFPRATALTIPPILVQTSQIGTFSTSFQRAGQYELNPGGSVALQFALPIAWGLKSSRLTLNVQGRYAGFAAQAGPLSRPGGEHSPNEQLGTPLGQLFVYNWRSGAWDSLPLNWGPNVLAAPAPYLSAVETVRVRFTYKPPPARPNASVQFSLDMSAAGSLA